MPNIECWLGIFVIFQGIWTSNAKKPYNLWFFRGEGVGPPVPPLDPHMQLGFLQNHEAHIKSHPTTSQTMIAL